MTIQRLQIRCKARLLLADYNRRQMQTICVNDPRVLTKTDIQRADLVFLDIDMGDINGRKLARQMRAIHKDFVLILLRITVNMPLKGMR